MQDRKALIEQQGKELLQDRFLNHMWEIHHMYKKDPELFVYELRKHVDSIYQRAAKLELLNISFLCINPLRSSLLTGSYDVQLILYDEKYYLSKFDLSEYWKPEFLYRYLQSDIEYIHCEMKKKIIRLTDYEIRSYVMNYAENYNMILFQFCLDNIQIFTELDSYEKMKRNEDFKILFGEYMMPATQLYPAV